MRWRVAACITVGVAAAFVGSRVPWVSVPQLLALVVVAGFVGVAWESRAVFHSETRQVQSTTRPGTFLIATLLACTGWGALSAATVSSAVLGATLMSALLVAWALGRKKVAPSVGVTAVAACSFLGYVLGIVLARNAL